MKRLLLVIALLSACKDQGPCETVIIEAEYSSPVYELDVDRADRYENDYGYDCVTESIRNGAGNRIGTKYTCTKC